LYGKIITSSTPSFNGDGDGDGGLLVTVAVGATFFTSAGNGCLPFPPEG